MMSLMWNEMDCLSSRNDRSVCVRCVLLLLSSILLVFFYFNKIWR